MFDTINPQFRKMGTWSHITKINYCFALECGVLLGQKISDFILQTPFSTLPLPFELYEDRTTKIRKLVKLWSIK